MRVSADWSLIFHDVFPLFCVDRITSGSYLSTGWFTLILAMDMCKEIRVYGMINDTYCKWVQRLTFTFTCTFSARAFDSCTSVVTTCLYFIWYWTFSLKRMLALQEYRIFMYPFLHKRWLDLDLFLKFLPKGHIRPKLTLFVELLVFVQKFFFEKSSGFTCPILRMGNKLALK